MSYNPNILSRNIRDLEYNKHTEIINDSRFPAVTSVLVGYDYEDGIQTNIYNKTAELVYLVNASDINQNITLSATNIQISNVGISGVAAVSGTVTVQQVNTPVQVTNSNTSALAVSGTVVVSSITNPLNVNTTTNVQAVSSGITNWDVLSASIASSSGYVTFTQLPSYNARSITITNQTGTQLNIKRTSGTGISLPLPSASGITLSLITNTNEISITQQSGNPVTVYATYSF